MNRRSLIVMRVVVIVLAAGLGIAFLARGDYLIGALVIALALTRVVMVVTVLRNRRRLDGRFPSGSP